MHLKYLFWICLSSLCISLEKFSLFAKIQCLNRSAYVEFMRKEAAENALSLDGTSFMSRILKVFNHCPLFFYSSSFILTFSVQLAMHIDRAVSLGYGEVFLAYLFHSLGNAILT